MENKIIYADGMFAKSGSVSFVKAKLGINVDKFTTWLKTHQNAQGYVNIDVLEGKDGLYAKLDTWKPAEKPDFHTSPTDGFTNGIDMATHPLNSPKEQEEYDKALKDW